MTEIVIIFGGAVQAQFRVEVIPRVGDHVSWRDRKFRCVGVHYQYAWPRTTGFTTDRVQVYLEDGPSDV